MRRKVYGATERPRLCVFRSLKHIYAQVIDDDKGTTLVAVSTQSPELKGAYGGNAEASKRVGALLASKAVEAGIQQVVFDRGGFAYHGRIKALADAAREGGLKF